MPQVTVGGRIGLPIETVWEFIKDMKNWAPCMPGYISFEEVDDKVSVWRLKGDVGIFQRAVNFNVTITEKVPPEKIAFTLEAKGEGIAGGGTYTAKPAGESETEMEFVLELNGQGMTKPVINALLSKTLPRDCETLKKNLIEVLNEKYGVSASDGAGAN
jgi:carbon monoxide dehydrogenase subunit G